MDVDSHRGSTHYNYSAKFMFTRRVAKVFHCFLNPISLSADTTSNDRMLQLHISWTECIKCYCNFPSLSWICKLFADSYSVILESLSRLSSTCMKHWKFRKTFTFFLTYSMPLVSLYTLWNHQKTYNEGIPGTSYLKNLRKMEQYNFKDYLCS